MRIMLFTLLASVLILNGSPNVHNHNTIILSESVATMDERRIEQESKELARRESTLLQSPGYESAEVERVYPDRTNNCYVWAERRSGIYRVGGWGGRKAINSQIPTPGSIGSMKFYYHAVFIESVDGDKITVLESNYLKNWIVRRVLNRSDFLGFVI